MSDSSAIGRAIVAKLRGDGTLTGLTGGVYLDKAPTDSKQHVIVSLVVGQDVHMFGGRAFENPMYLVKAVELSSITPHEIDAAAARIDALLEGGTLTITGYAFKAMRRDEPIAYTENDERDPSITFFHAGGRYQVFTAPL